MGTALEPITIAAVVCAGAAISLIVLMVVRRLAYGSRRVDERLGAYPHGPSGPPVRTAGTAVSSVGNRLDLLRGISHAWMTSSRHTDRPVMLRKSIEASPIGEGAAEPIDELKVVTYAEGLRNMGIVPSRDGLAVTSTNSPSITSNASSRMLMRDDSYAAQLSRPAASDQVPGQNRMQPVSSPDRSITPPDPAESGQLEVPRDSPREQGRGRQRETAWLPSYYERAESGFGAQHRPGYI